MGNHHSHDHHHKDKDGGGIRRSGGQAHAPGRSHVKKIQNLQHLTQLNDTETKELKELFLDVSDGEDWVDREKFSVLFKHLREAGLARNIQPFQVERLYTIFDADGDGRVDLNEFLMGTALLCKGTPEEKLSLTFQLVDTKDKSFIDRQELFHFFKSSYLRSIEIAAEMYPDISREDVEDTQRHAAAVCRNLVVEAFGALDVNADGKLSFEEFKRWVLEKPRIVAEIDGMQRDHVDLAEVKMSLLNTQETIELKKHSEEKSESE